MTHTSIDRGTEVKETTHTLQARFIPIWGSCKATPEAAQIGFNGQNA